MQRIHGDDNQQAGKATSILLVILVLVGLGTLALVLMNRRDQVVGENEEIRYDDLGFVVTATRYEKSIGTGSGAIAPHGTFCLVTLEVRNHAQRESYKFDPKIAVLTDDKGREVVYAPRAQAVVTAEGGGDPCADAIPAGQSCTTELAFDVPSDSRELLLRLSFTNAVRDLVDVVFWGRKRIRLAPP